MFSFKIRAHKNTPVRIHLVNITGAFNALKRCYKIVL